MKWTDCDLDGASMSVKRSLDETKAGLRYNSPKSKGGKRTISLPPSGVAVLREHRRRQLELRLALGLAKPGADALVFCRSDGSPMSPDDLSRDWIRTCKSLVPAPGYVPRSAPHPRHRLDCRRPRRGRYQPAHRPGSPNVTLGTYGHPVPQYRRGGRQCDRAHAETRTRGVIAVVRLQLGGNSVAIPALFCRASMLSACPA